MPTTRNHVGQVPPAHGHAHGAHEFSSQRPWSFSGWPERGVPFLQRGEGREGGGVVQGQRRKTIEEEFGPGEWLVVGKEKQRPLEIHCACIGSCATAHCGTFLACGATAP